MKRNPFRRGTGWALAVLVLVAPATRADDRRPVSAPELDLAEVKVFSTGVDLTPNVRYERAVLTVSGPDITFIQEFDSRTPPSIGFFDPQGNLLPDGVYRWELSLVPDEVTASRLRESAAENGGEAPEAWLPKSGSFAIRAGAIALPEQVEESAGEGRARIREASPEAARFEAEPRTFGGQILGEKALGSRSEAADTDDAVAGGLADEVELLKRAVDWGAAGERVGPQGAAERSSGPDSDRAAMNQGFSLEKAAHVAAPGAREIKIRERISPTDGKNGRPREER